MRKKQLAPRKRPVQERSKETVEAILEAAVQVFSKQGYERGTVSRIAERAGVSIGSLYQYFPTKDAIVVALMERHMETTADRVARLAEQTVQDRPPLDEVILRFVQAMTAVYLGDLPLIKVIYEEAPRPEAVNLRQAEVMKLVALGIVDVMRAYPEITVADLELSAHLLVQLVDAQVRAFALMPMPGYDADLLVAELAELLRRYLTAPQRSPAPGASKRLSLQQG